MEQRANIKFCVKLEKKFAETYELMKKVYGDDCMSRTILFKGQFDCFDISEIVDNYYIL